MPPIGIQLFLHQPIRLRPYSFLEIGQHLPYEDTEAYSQEIKQCLAGNLPTLLANLTDLKTALGKKLDIHLSISGALLEWMIAHSPSHLNELKNWATGVSAYFTSTNYCHSLATWYLPQEDTRQQNQQLQLVKGVFGGKIRWGALPAVCYSICAATGQACSGAKIDAEVGEWLLDRSLHIVLPEAKHWVADTRTRPIWLQNQMQESALQKLFSLYPLLLNPAHGKWFDQWRRMQAAEHFFQMHTAKPTMEGQNPFDAFINYMNILSDLEQLLKK